MSYSGPRELLFQGWARLACFLRDLGSTFGKEAQPFEAHVANGVAIYR